MSSLVYSRIDAPVARSRSDSSATPSCTPIARSWSVRLSSQSRFNNVASRLSLSGPSPATIRRHPIVNASGALAPEIPSTRTPVNWKMAIYCASALIAWGLVATCINNGSPFLSVSLAASTTSHGMCQPRPTPWPRSVTKLPYFIFLLLHRQYHASQSLVPPRPTNPYPPLPLCPPPAQDSCPSRRSPLGQA